MKKPYAVALAQTTTETATVEVWAESREEAEFMAEALARAGKVTWWAEDHVIGAKARLKKAAKDT